MQALIGKKWFLLTGESAFDAFSPIPSREVRVYEGAAENCLLSIIGVCRDDSYEWTHEIVYDGKEHSLQDRSGATTMISTLISDSKNLAVLFKNGTVVGVSCGEVKIDDKGREILQISSFGLANCGQPYFNRLKYISAKI